MNIIGIYSPRPQSGKTAVANQIQRSIEYAQRAPFAGPLKQMMRPMLDLLGVSPDLLYHGDKTVEILPGVTLRHALQTLGTEWGRTLIHQDVWVKLWQGGITSSSRDRHLFVADDVRFHNEAHAVWSMGGEMWCVCRPDQVGAPPAHESEGGLSDWKFDRIIVNDGTLSELNAKVREALKDGGYLP